MNKKQIIILILILSLAILFSLNTTAKNLKIHFIDVGQGDSILIESVGGENILVDGGDRADIIAETIINYLKAQNIKKLDYIISTHPHADHIGGLVDIIDNFEVKKILDSGKIHSSKTYENYLIKIDQKNIDFNTPRQGDEIQLNSVKLKFLHPDQNLDAYSLNNSSLVFILEYKNQRFLFTGDIEKEIEKELLQENPELKIDILKVAHHGSDTSSYLNWIKSLSPSTAVIQVGADNSYDHPKTKTLTNYRSLGINLYRNDLNGNIVVTADGNNYTVKVDRALKKSTEQSYPDPKIKANSKSSKLININQADLKTLDQLWGIGKQTAEKIIHYRKNNGPFKVIEEIMNIDGISTGKFKRWQHKITVN